MESHAAAAAAAVEKGAAAAAIAGDRRSPGAARVREGPSLNQSGKGREGNAPVLVAVVAVSSPLSRWW